MNNTDLSMWMGVVSYDGSLFFGWQKNKDQPTVELELEKVMKRLWAHVYKLEGASRTDRGVHATGQVITFQCPTHFKKEKLIRAMNALLPGSIQILHLQEISNNFHPTLDALDKTYRYYIYNNHCSHPLLKHVSWHIPYQLDHQIMKSACHKFIGTHDFKAFCNQKNNETYLDYERTVLSFKFHDLENSILMFEITGNAFLYKMVRNLVGMVVYCGMGKACPTQIEEILMSKDRKLAGITAPAQGLILHNIRYKNLQSCDYQKEIFFQI